MIPVDQHKSHHPSVLAKYVPEWMERTLSMLFAFILRGCRATFRCWRPRGRVGRFSRSAKVRKLPAGCGSSELSAHQRAPSGGRCALRGRPALEPMEILSSVQRRELGRTPLGDGDSEPRRSSPRWTVFLCASSFALSRSSFRFLFFYL